MTLTFEEEKLIQESWKRIEEIGLQKVGIIIFVRFFLDFPEVLPLFKNFVSSDVLVVKEDLESNHLFSKHALSVIKSIGRIVAALDHAEAINKEIKRVAAYHAGLPLDPVHFEMLAQVLMSILQEVLDKKADDDVIIAWAKAYDLIKHDTLEKINAAKRKM